MVQPYDFSINSLQGKPIDLALFNGKVLLIVNTASKCGFTPQYKELEELHKKYSDKGLVIVGVPCNQFGHQEPDDAKIISEQYLTDYGVDFIVTEKIEVNGADSHPLFTYLRNALPGLFGNNIKWNFTKFLIGRDGKPIARFAPITKPNKLEKDIKKALG